MDGLKTADTDGLPRVEKPPSSRSRRMWSCAAACLRVWEIYPILLVAVFLRLYQFPVTEFDADQAAIFNLARQAVVHGLIPVTTNYASIRILNPPATVYLLMLGAAFSANPLAGLFVTDLLNVLAVLFTYIVVRRYYGRFAGTVAALLYAVAQLAVFYGSFLWNQNLLAPFVPLFLFALLWGVVERRRGWLPLAVVLWGWMIQLHGSAVLLGVPLVLACILAWRTLRWRDLWLAVGLLVLIYAPYIVWEVASHFADVPVLLQNLREKSVIDSQALHAYRDFLNPYPSVPSNPLTWQFKIYRLLHWGGRGMEVITACAFVFTLFAVCQRTWQLLRFAPKGQASASPASGQETPAQGAVRGWWMGLVTTPWRAGLLVLLAWQVVPVLYLSRHSLHIYDYYLLILMPGPFILIGIFSSQLAQWARAFRFPWPLLARFALYLLLAGLALSLALGSFTRTLDRANGYNNPTDIYYTLQDTQNALRQAETLAQTYHAQSVSLALDLRTSDALTYLAESMRTPHTTFDASNCLPLPGPTQGPTLILFGPADREAESLLTHATAARLVGESPRPGGPSFHLYLVQPAALAIGSTSFLNQLAPAAGPAQAVTLADGAPRLLTRWTVLHSAAPAYSKTYKYQLNASLHGQGIQSAQAGEACSLSSLQAGEQLLVAFRLPGASGSTLTLSGSTWTTTPYEPAYGPLHLETFVQHASTMRALQPSDGKRSITLHG